MSNLRVMTIGHSNHALEAFMSLLERHRVTAIADVRSTPYSKFAPQYRKESIRASLRERGISYAFLGTELGGRSSDRTCYQDGRVVYKRLAQTRAFGEGLERTLRGAQSERIALMCTEKDPLDCHRTLLVARALVDLDVDVDHILATGEVETHHDSMMRLLDKVGFEQLDLFIPLDERIRVAAQLQETRIAYVDRSLANTQGAGAL